MRFASTVLVLLFLSALHTDAQVTISSSDLPSAGDTFRVSTAAPSAVLDLTTTGPNSVWDFSSLVSSGQTIDTFLSVNATAPVFSVVFSDVSFNPNRSNQATRGQAFNLGAVSVSDVFNFFYNSSARYEQSGFGASVNGAQLPVIYSPHDVHYEFPLAFGNSTTSNSGYELDLISTVGIFFKVNRTRSNIVDGWGSVATPHGNYDAIRVKTTIVEQDSVYVDSLGFGFNLPPFTTTEYKWLSNGEGIPVLQINTNGTGTVTQIRYKDSPLTSVSEIAPDIQWLQVFPNPVNTLLTMRWNAERSFSVDLELTDIQGRSVFFEKVTGAAGPNFRMLDVGSLQLAAGEYLIRLGRSVERIQVRH